MLSSLGSFVTLGSRSFQCVCGEMTGTGYPLVVTPRRVLPPTPGQSVKPAPPKPRRHKQQGEVGVSLARMEPTSPPLDQLDEGIRQRLQRIAAEISARLIGYEGRKPPPVSCCERELVLVHAACRNCSHMNKLETVLDISYFISSSAIW